MKQPFNHSFTILIFPKASSKTVIPVYFMPGLLLAAEELNSVFNAPSIFYHGIQKEVKPKETP